jgi:hypothetical protein
LIYIENYFFLSVVAESLAPILGKVGAYIEFKRNIYKEVNVIFLGYSLFSNIGVDSLVSPLRLS